MNLEVLCMAEIQIRLVEAERRVMHTFLYEKENYESANRERRALKEEYEKRLYGRK